MSIQILPELSPMLPGYYRLERTILKYIEDGIWKPGDLIPSEREIARVCNISVGTVRKALENLVHEGSIVRVQGKGTFVACSFIDNRTSCYYRMAPSLSESTITMSLKCLERSFCQPAPFIEEFLSPGKSLELFQINRLFLTPSGREYAPVLYCRSTFCESVGRILSPLETEEFEKQSLYITMQQKTGMTIGKNQEALELETVPEEIADLLGVGRNAVLLKSTILVTSDSGLPLEVRQSWIRTDRYKMVREWKI